MKEEPKYRIGDVVIYKGLFGYFTQGVVKNATFFEESEVFDGWRYYISGRWRGIDEDKIITRLTPTTNE